MILKQIVYIPRYKWNVVVFYNTKNIDAIIDELESVKCAKCNIDKIIEFLSKDNVNTGFIYTNKMSRSSVIVICRSTSLGEFVNTIEHEKNHLEMHICDSIGIDPFSEEAAILSGEISQIFLDDALSSIIY